MDDWRLQQQQQQQQRMAMNNPGPIHSYPSIRSRPAPYPYPQPAVKPDFHSNSYTLSPMYTNKPSQQPMSLHRSRTMPYAPYPYPSSQQSTFYPAYPIKSKSEDAYSSYPTVVPPAHAFIPAQQLPPLVQDYQPAYSTQSQIFPSPPSNPSTPYQGEFADFGVPYHHGQPSSVSSLTDALCPSGESVDRQAATPGPPSVGTPRVPPHPYSFPHTPSTPRLSTEANLDELTAFLQDPMSLYLSEDFASTLLEDIEVLAHTYLGIRAEPAASAQPSGADADLDYDIILNYLCSDELVSPVCAN